MGKRSHAPTQCIAHVRVGRSRTELPQNAEEQQQSSTSSSCVCIFSLSFLLILLVAVVSLDKNEVHSFCFMNVLAILFWVAPGPFSLCR